MLLEYVLMVREDPSLDLDAELSGGDRALPGLDGRGPGAARARRGLFFGR